MKYLLLTLLLTGCSLQKGSYPAPKDYHVHIINKQACASEWEEAKEYYLSLGIRIVEDRKAEYRYVCLYNPFGFMRKIICPIDAAGITQFGDFDSNTNTSWSFNSTRTIIHELGHLLFHFGHSGSGLMTPEASAIYLATGFTDEQLEKMK